MTKKWLGVLTLVTMIGLIVGCQLPRVKQLEQESNELRLAMKEKEELLAQAQAQTGKQTETIGACRQKLTTQQKRIDDLEMVKFELDKQFELCQVQLKKQTEESARLGGIVENYQKQIQELNDQLGAARQAVASLQNQIKGLNVTTEKPAAGASTQPAGQ